MRDFSPFENRLRKNARHWGKWARRENVGCYRLYDRDVPEFPFVVDRYESRIHLQEIDTGWYMEEVEYAKWLSLARASVAVALELPIEAVRLKRRERQKGISQYQKTGIQGEDFVVHEGGHRFIVNLDEYLDTGLFLDHRNTRAMIQSLSAGRRFLNLFAYTGSFTVYAAAGGAVSSVTVDLSNTYQDWSRRNFELNGMDLQKHLLARADVFRFLDEARQREQVFDLIVMDPPTFSNSAKMQGVLDVQRDHSYLVADCMSLLAPDGVLFFSNNLRSFKLDETLFERYKVAELSHVTVPEDYRNKKIHRCWQIAAQEGVLG